MNTERSQNEIAQEIIEFAPNVEPLVEEWFAVLSRVHSDMNQERDRYRSALEELAANKHSFHRPAGAIAKAALEGRELPE